MDNLKSLIHERLIPRLTGRDPVELGAELVADLVDELADELAARGDHLSPSRAARLRADAYQEVVALGPLHSLMVDSEVTEILVNGPHDVFVERLGKKARAAVHFRDLEHLRYCVQRILQMSPGRRVDEAQPFVDLWLDDGSRINIILPPVVLGAPHLSIRKYARWYEGIGDLVAIGTLDRRMAEFLHACVHAKRSILFSGATGAGKTTLLEVVGAAIPDTERLVVIEDTLELRFQQPDVVRLLSRMANVEGKGEISIGDLFHNSLRMRPDRVILGELRGREALDYLQAITSGHRGSLAVIHASTPEEAVLRLENLTTMAGRVVPLASVRSQIAHGLDIIVQLERMVDGKRRVTRITEVTGVGGDGNVVVKDLFVWKAVDRAADGHIEGRFEATGNLPTFVEDLRLSGELQSLADFAAPGAQRGQGSAGALGRIG